MHQDQSAGHSSTFNDRKMCQFELSHGIFNAWASLKSQKYPVKKQIPSIPFIPAISAITSSQDLQWMVEPGVLASRSGHCLLSHPHKFLELSKRQESGSHTQPAVSWRVGSSHGRNEWRGQLNPSDEKRRLRREKNKLAAAKVRNRRRELTEQLQGDNDKLARKQASLQTQVKHLQEEREKLERLLVSHTRVCQLGCDSRPQAQPRPPPILTTRLTQTPPPARLLSPPPAVKQEPLEEVLFSSPAWRAPHRQTHLSALSGVVSRC